MAPYRSSFLGQEVWRWGFSCRVRAVATFRSQACLIEGSCNIPRSMVIVRLLDWRSFSSDVGELLQELLGALLGP